MNPLLFTTLILIAVGLALIGLSLIARAARRHRAGVQICNVGETRHGDTVSRIADALNPVGTFFSYYYLVKQGVQAGSFAICTGPGDKPIGVVIDQPNAVGALAAIKLPNTNRTEFIQAAGAINPGDTLEPAAGGLVQTMGQGAGVHYQVGYALNAAVNPGDLVEVVLQFGVVKF